MRRLDQARQAADWYNLVRAAEMRSRKFQETARVRYMRVRDGLCRWLRIRHSIVLSVGALRSSGVPS